MGQPILALHMQNCCKWHLALAPVVIAQVQGIKGRNDEAGLQRKRPRITQPYVVCKCCMSDIIMQQKDNIKERQ